MTLDCCCRQLPPLLAAYLDCRRERLWTARNLEAGAQLDDAAREVWVVTEQAAEALQEPVTVLIEAAEKYGIDPSPLLRLKRASAPLPLIWCVQTVAELRTLTGAALDEEAILDTCDRIALRLGNHEADGAAAAKRKPRRRGRQKASDETIRQENRMADDWKQARESGVYKAKFARDNGVSVHELENLLGRVYRRKKRSDKKRVKVS